MNKDQLIRRTFQSAAAARQHSTGELWNARLHQPLPERIAKVGFAKTMRVVLPSSIKVGKQKFNTLSSGGEQLVFSSSDEVAKVIFNSLSFDKLVAEAKANEYQGLYQTARAHLGRQILATDFDLKRFKSGLFAAIALQPRLNPDRWFGGVEELLDYRQDDNYINEIDLLHSSLINLREVDGLQMDLNGPNNIALAEDSTSPALKIVDTLPVTPESQRMVMSGRKISRGELNLEWMGMIQNHIAQTRPTHSLSPLPAVH